MSDRFKDTGDFLPTWNCKYTGSTKEGNLTKLEANDNSWIVGWYIGTRDGDINGDPIKIHTIRVVECGDQSHLSEENDGGATGKDYEFIGDHVINDRLATKIQKGQSCKIQWIGLVKPKKEGGRPYHGWRLFEDTQTEPIVVQNGMVVEDLGSSSHEVAESADIDNVVKGDEPVAKLAEAVAKGDPTIAEDDDDLPF